MTREFERKPPADGKQDERLITRIKVESGDGARFPTPQKILDSLLGALSFDPLSFTRKTAREQYDALKTLVGLDFTEDESENKIDYDKRTDMNRTAKEKRAAAEAIEVAPDTPDEVVDVNALLGELDAAETKNRERQNIEDYLAEQARDLRELHDRIVSKAREIESLKEEVEIAQSRVSESESEVESITDIYKKQAQKLDEHVEVPDAIDVTPIKARISDSERVNRNVNAKWMRDGYIEDSDAAQDRAEGCTERISERTDVIQQAIERADMPVPGLSLNNGIVTLNDHPLEQASDAEQLRVSCAIAMRGDHKLKVIRVRDGSLLDDDSLAVLRQTAAEHDYQVWIERVDTSGTIGFVIEAGQLLTKMRE